MGMGMADGCSDKQNVRLEMAAAPSSSSRGRSMAGRRWRSSMASGLRAALACTIVGVVSVYAPPALLRHITFPAFSYVVTVIIITDDATVGAALRAVASAAHATAMGAVPSVLALWLAQRMGESSSTTSSVLGTSALVALSAFAVAVPESPGPVAKRIALGQIIIIYVAKFRQLPMTNNGLGVVVQHPANVVACTALGAAAALLAVLLPWPRLATREVEEKSVAYMENAAERVRLLVDAFLLRATVTAEEEEDEEEEEVTSGRRRRRWCVAACMSEAHRLASASAALLRRITSVKGDLQWERVVRLGAAGTMPAADEQERIEMPIKGMEIAVSSTNYLPRPAADQAEMTIINLSCLEQMRDQIRLSLLTATSTRHHITKMNNNNKRSTTMSLFGGAAAERHELELSPFLFLFSMHLLRHPTLLLSHSLPDSTNKVTPASPQLEEPDQDDQQEDQQDSEPEEESKMSTDKEQKKKCRTLLVRRWGLQSSRLKMASKCAVSLGLAVLLGLLFNNDHGFWSGLIVATTMAPVARGSTWAVAVARAHGTAIGSVYGVLACLLSQQRHLMELRFLALLPWIVLATFLKRSRAYGPAGGVAAALSGIIIVGRRYDEPPMAFTISRLVETFIGLSCTVATDLAFQPKATPSARARTQLPRCFTALRDCLTRLPSLRKNQQEQHKMLLEQVALLGKYAAEAGAEPNFLWMAPFPASCYAKVHGSLSRMAQLLGLYLHAQAIIVDNTSYGSQLLAGTDVKRFHNRLSASLPELELDEDTDFDLEDGNGKWCEDMAVVVKSFIGHAREALLQEEEEEEEQHQQLNAYCLGSIGFCMGEMMKEAQQLEALMLDLSLQLQPTN